MTIVEVTNKFNLYKDGNDYVVTTRRNREVFRGTKADCRNFMEQNPYGVVIKKEENEMTKAMEITVNNTIYTRNAKGNYFYKSTGKTDKKGNPIMVRCSEKVFLEALTEWESSAGAKERKEKAEKSDKAAEKKINSKKRVRKSKDIAYEGYDITLTAKQVDFILHIPDTNFYEKGLDSTPWCDVLADEIGGQFTNKPMTVGAMISTLREKGIIYVGQDKINNRKCKFFGFTDLGKKVAKGVGLK